MTECATPYVNDIWKLRLARYGASELGECVMWYGGSAGVLVADPQHVAGEGRARQPAAGRAAPLLRAALAPPARTRYTLIYASFTALY